MPHQDDAIASGHGAYKLEENEDDPNVFTVNIGNLPPGKEADIVISYVTELQFEEGQVHPTFTHRLKGSRSQDLILVLSMLLEQSSSSSSCPPVTTTTTCHTKLLQTPCLSSSSVLTLVRPLVSISCSHQQWSWAPEDAQHKTKGERTLMRISTFADMTSNIKSLSSPSHPISFEFGEEPSQATVTMSDDSPQASQAKDLVVLTKLAKPHQYCTLARRPGSYQQLIETSCCVADRVDG